MQNLGLMMMDPTLLSCLSLFDSTLSVDQFFGFPQSLLEPLPNHLEGAKRALDWCTENHVTILHPGHELYPQAFLGLERPPLFLSCLGNVERALRDRPRLAVVGTREPTKRSLSWLEHHLGEFLRRREAVIVSGGARGIDQRAHLVAIRAGAPTLVFLPSGLTKIYPREISSWREPILDSGGLLISPYAPTQEIRKSHFEGRNRLIAALGQVVLIAEARRRSGSLMTARLAAELGRTLAVLPSFPGEPQSAGTLDLLFNGAFPLRDSEDLLTLFDYRGTSFNATLGAN